MKFQAIALPACEAGAAHPSWCALPRTQSLRYSGGGRKGLLCRAVWLTQFAGWRLLVTSISQSVPGTWQEPEPRGSPASPAPRAIPSRGGCRSAACKTIPLQRLQSSARLQGGNWGLLGWKSSTNLPHESWLEKLFIAPFGIYRVALAGRQQKAQIYQN